MVTFACCIIRSPVVSINFQDEIGGIAVDVLLDIYMQRRTSALIRYAVALPDARFSIASLSALCCPQLVHLLDALLEFEVLALFIRMSLVLGGSVSMHRSFPSFPKRALCVPRTSMADRTPRIDTGSMGSEDVRMSLGRAGAALQRSSPRG